VNLASRLTDQATAGEILISDAVRRRLPPAFRCREVGALTVKGLAEPVTAWHLTGVDGSAAATAERPFVGRRAELAQFRGALEACRESGAGQTIHLRGEAGIGKTRLVEELQGEARAQGFAIHQALVLDFGAGTGRDAIGALVRSLVGDGAADTAEAAERAFGEGLLAEERRVSLNDLLALPQPLELRSLSDAMGHERRNRARQETLAELVHALAARRPRLLVVEDVHWADRPTLDQLAALAQSIAGVPALLVMTSRIEGDPLDRAWRAATGNCPLLTLDLGPLRPQEAEALAAAYLEANSAFAQRCLARAAGNPLFLDQLLRHAEDRLESAVPGSVQSLVQARVDQLEPFDKQALLAAAVFGQRFALDALRAIIERPDYDAAGLVRHLLVRPQGEHLLFAHALIRDAVYDSLLKASRRALHGRAAAWFAARDAVLHAEHLARAEDSAAAAAYLAAARQQAVAYRYEQAVALVDQGLAVAREETDRLALTCLQGELLHDLGQMAPARQAFEAALAAAGNERARCRVWLGLAAVKRVTDDLDGAFADLDRAIAVAERHQLVEELARIHFLRGNLNFPRGRIEACLAEHRESLAFARRSASPELEAQALGGLADAEYARGRMLTAHRHFKDCVELCQRHGLGRIEVANRPMAAITQVYSCDFPGALAEALEALAAAERVGHQRAALIACHGVHFSTIPRGDIELAIEYAERGLAGARALGARRFEGQSLAFLGDARWRAGDRAAGLALVREGIAISRESGIAYIGPMLLGALARLTDDAEERRAALAEGEALLAAGSISHNYLWFYHEAIETALAGSAWADALRYAAALEDYTRGEPLPWAEFYVARGRALATWGQGAREVATVGSLRRLREQAQAARLTCALPALERALAGGDATSRSPPI
jgi:tetratricopeptide (TPR) repeat protein